LGSPVVRDLHAALCGGLEPDLTLLLLPNFDQSLARARRRNQRNVAATGSDENRFETESSAFYRRVFDKYQEIAARDSLRVAVIDSNGSIDEIHQRIVLVVRGRLASV
jgi:dTMP kinase